MCVNVLSFKPGFNRHSRSKLHKRFFFCKILPGYFYREMNGNVFSVICLCFAVVERIVTVFWNKINNFSEVYNYNNVGCEYTPFHDSKNESQTVYETD